MKASLQSLPSSWWFPVVAGRTGMCPCRVYRLFLHQDSQEYDSSNVNLTGTPLGATLISPWDHMQVTIPR